MEILLWLLPAAVVTLLAAWGASVAARREEQQRLERDRRVEAARAADGAADPRPEPAYDDLGGVSTPRPARRPAEQPERTTRPEHGRPEHERPEHRPGDQRRSA